MVQTERWFSVTTKLRALQSINTLVIGRYLFGAIGQTASVPRRIPLSSIPKNNI